MNKTFEKILEMLEKPQFDIGCGACPNKENCDKVQENINDEKTDLCAETMRVIAKEIVQEVAEEYNDRWIPCSERLPDIEADVLLTLRSLGIYKGFRANTDGYFYVEGTDDGYIPFDNVIAWQPLPEPYNNEN